MVMSIGNGNFVESIPITVETNTFTLSVYHLVGVKCEYRFTDAFLAEEALMVLDGAFGGGMDDFLNLTVKEPPDASAFWMGMNLRRNPCRPINKIPDGLLMTLRHFGWV